MIKKTWFLWWGWDPEKVEKWLEEMELRGWNLYNVGTMALNFSFKKGESRKVRYCADYQSEYDENYFNIFEDDGWELVWEGTGWYIWKKPYTDERPAIYTDVNSFVERNNRLFSSLLPIFLWCIPIMTLLIIPNWDISAYRYIFWFYLVLLVLYLIVFYQLRKASDKLKKETIRE